MTSRTWGCSQDDLPHLDLLCSHWQWRTFKHHKNWSMGLFPRTWVRCWCFDEFWGLIDVNLLECASFKPTASATSFSYRIFRMWSEVVLLSTLILALLFVAIAVFSVVRPLEAVTARTSKQLICCSTIRTGRRDVYLAPPWLQYTAGRADSWFWNTFVVMSCKFVLISQLTST